MRTRHIVPHGTVVQQQKPRDNKIDTRLNTTRNLIGSILSPRPPSSHSMDWPRCEVAAPLNAGWPSNDILRAKEKAIKIEAHVLENIVQGQARGSLRERYIPTATWVGQSRLQDPR